MPSTLQLESEGFFRSDPELDQAEEGSGHST